MWHPSTEWSTLIIAQTDGTQEVAPPPATGDNTASTTDPSSPGANNDSSGGGGGGPDIMLLMLLGVLVFMVIFSLSAGRKEKKKRAELMSSMSKGDTVQTVGGVLGTVVEIKDDEVLLKVDENANTKIRFSKSAIQTVLETKA